MRNRKQSHLPAKAAAKSTQSKRKKAPFIWGAALLITVGAAISSPTTAATGTLPVSDLSALALIAPIALLLTALVVSVWKQTARNALSSPEQFARAQTGASRKRR